ncbi:MAG: NAD-binding protein, partial [Magnetococcales bacterium]|nr:NAD-binding protein [Magnetococcales bacterium]
EYLLRWWISSNFTRDFISSYRRVRRRSHRPSWILIFWRAFRIAIIPKLKWMLEPQSIVDLLAILPIFRAFRLLRVLRVLLVLKLFRYSKRLSFFTGIIKDNSEELISLFTVAFVVWGMVAVAFFIVERAVNPGVSNFWESFYWSIITITTVGYGDITPKTTAGQVIAVAGTLFGMWVVVFMTSLIVTGLTERIAMLKEHRMRQKIDRLRHHFIVCGLDGLGRAVCRTLEEEGERFVAVDTDPAKVEAALKNNWIAVEGDVLVDDTWNKVGLKQARCVISSMVAESANVYIILMVREQRPDCFIVGCGSTRVSEKRLLKLGANRVITPFDIGGRQMAYTALRPSALRFFDMALRRGHVELEMEEVIIPEDSTFEGVTLMGSEIRSSFNVIVVAIMSPEGQLDFNPTATTVLKVNDLLICLGHLDDLARLREATKM